LYVEDVGVSPRQLFDLFGLVVGLRQLEPALTNSVTRLSHPCGENLKKKLRTSRPWYLEGTNTEDGEIMFLGFCHERYQNKTKLKYQRYDQT
jgi:hypothetical protein